MDDFMFRLDPDLDAMRDEWLADISGVDDAPEDDDLSTLTDNISCENMEAS